MTRKHAKGQILAEMPLIRVLEPEVMDSEDEASGYDAMDHGVVNARFCDDLLALDPDLARTLDVGTGTARVAIELARRSSANIVGVDLADAMLRLAASNVRDAGLEARITLARADAKGLAFADGAFTCVMCNTILHHIPDPEPALAEMLRVTAPGGVLFVRDLVRPEAEAHVMTLVARYAASETEVQRALFEASLRAAFTLDEARSFARRLGRSAKVDMTSDRHWTLTAGPRT